MPCVRCRPWRAAALPQGTDHLLRLAEVHVLLAPAARLGVLDVHQADEGHGAATQQQDGEEHNDDGGRADELPLLHGLQVQVQAQGIGDGSPQAWGRGRGGAQGRAGMSQAGGGQRPDRLGTRPHPAHSQRGIAHRRAGVQDSGEDRMLSLYWGSFL